MCKIELDTLCLQYACGSESLTYKNRKCGMITNEILTKSQEMNEDPEKCSTPSHQFQAVFLQ